MLVYFGKQLDFFENSHSMVIFSCRKKYMKMKIVLFNLLCCYMK